MKNMALAYGMKKKMMKAKGGMVNTHDMPEASVKSEMTVEPDPIDHAASEAAKKELYVDHEEGINYAKGGCVDRIMAKRKAMAEGGVVANDTVKHDELDQYDDLVLDDNLESHITGDQEMSTPGEEMRRSDMVARIMASRKKKDRLPNPR